MKRRKNADFLEGRDLTAELVGDEGFRRCPNYVVHFRRLPHHEVGIPPFWELHVQNSLNAYTVNVGIPADELDFVIQRLPEPSPEKEGVVFVRARDEVILPEGIRRLCGETLLPFLIYKVVSAPLGSPFKNGQRYNDADLTRPIAPTEADKVANERRKQILLDRFAQETEQGYSPSPRF
ncbi:MULTISPECIES: hypothetical protein [unclassified Mesorhizobium]|uniref:hypothetical protein n=1 Tax=unclassified Mesorhizobium TaxID=325217 RepID=UPI001093EB41|nr:MULTISPECIES: hypothetical protein [unclassified Mesorhizobium]TGQ73008.1 hypothetical protein EN848_06735 [bacterium M00.F.Ca.ET.205.01.1.1]TGU53764.1 hypothetical protein EN795_11155 [bacterium M00.F.Ca.ET.152.01.1.1]TGV37262.1 hypothetical protein EN829_011180 [Mesorhizobium sp. M00.F.Ca.ET.186.01.1.1]TGW07415.1 hypothetical protein EN788_36905 [Mesorhizobium sp. M2D.F.Ca.ET.145.01.1.1]TGZ39367.1 hypothetical protein EN805_28835 [bacterium M00.F.Ca.ET.162.01.1.1]